MSKPFEDTVRGIITRYEGVPLGDTEAQVQAILNAHTAAVEEARAEERKSVAKLMKKGLAQLKEQPK